MMQKFAYPHVEETLYHEVAQWAERLCAAQRRLPENVRDVFYPLRLR